MSRAHLLCVIIGLITPLVVSKHVQFYRKDYTYVKDYDAYYKVHWDTSGFNWSSAFSTCYEEGAKLFYPSGDEWTIIQNLTNAMTEAPNTTEVYVGLHDEFNLGEFITIDGNPTDSPLNVQDDVNVINRCIMMDYVTGTFRVNDCNTRPRNTVIPFICKKLDDESCPTIDTGYKYVKNAKKCYKVNNIPKTWQEAMQTCYMEGGLLAVLENKVNVDLNLKNDYNYYIGFRRMFSSLDFYTVKGNKFENENFNTNYYDSNYPNEYNLCGMIRYNNNNNPTIEASNCYKLRPFICEMAMK